MRHTHKKDSQICILTEAGELIERRIRTEPPRFAAVLGDRPRARSRTRPDDRRDDLGQAAEPRCQSAAGTDRPLTDLDRQVGGRLAADPGEELVDVMNDAQRLMHEITSTTSANVVGARSLPRWMPQAEHQVFDELRASSAVR